MMLRTMMQRTGKWLGEMAGSRAGRRIAPLMAAALLAAVAVSATACGDDAAVGGPTQDDAAHEGTGMGYGRQGAGRIATALTGLVDDGTLTGEQMVAVEEAIEANIDESPMEQGGGGRDWTLRLSQIQTALDGMVADGKLSEELATAIMAAIEANLPDQQLDHDGSPAPESTESTTTTAI